MIGCAVRIFLSLSYAFVLVFFLFKLNNNVNMTSNYRTLAHSLLYSILAKNQFESVMQEFKADIYMRQIWNESRLAFSNRDHALILQHETLDKIWLPDTYFENAVNTHVQTRNTYCSPLWRRLDSFLSEV